MFPAFTHTAMHDSALDYDSLLTALEKLDTEVTLGEIHGTLTGLLCAHLAQQSMAGT
jgi:uncharacterized protein YgfB (UPF0149 family)